MPAKIFGKHLTFAKAFHDLSGELHQPGQYRLANVSFGRISYIELAPPLRLASTQGRVSFFLPLTKLATVLGQPAIANLKVAALPRGILKRTVIEMFKRFAPRVKIDPETDFDKVFTVLAHRALNPYKRFFSRDDYDDIILDTLLAVLNKKTIEAYDPSQNVVSYLGGMFQMRLKNVIRDRLARSKYEHEIPNLTDGQSVDEYLENIDSREQDGDAVNELEFKQLMSKLQAFLSKQPEAKYYIPMLDLMLKGYSNREIANELNVSPTIISRYFGRLKDVIYRFAKGVNPELADAMEKMLGQNRAAVPVYQHYNPADPAANRTIQSWFDLHSLEFPVKVGVDTPKPGDQYLNNNIMKVLTPGDEHYTTVMGGGEVISDKPLPEIPPAPQSSAPPAGGNGGWPGAGGQAITPPVNSKPASNVPSWAQ